MTSTFDDGSQRKWWCHLHPGIYFISSSSFFDSSFSARYPLMFFLSFSVEEGNSAKKEASSTDPSFLWNHTHHPLQNRRWCRSCREDSFRTWSTYVTSEGYKRTRYNARTSYELPPLVIHLASISIPIHVLSTFISSCSVNVSCSRRGLEEKVIHLWVVMNVRYISFTWRYHFSRTSYTCQSISLVRTTSLTWWHECNKNQRKMKHHVQNYITSCSWIQYEMNRLNINP